MYISSSFTISFLLNLFHFRTSCFPLQFSFCKIFSICFVIARLLFTPRKSLYMCNDFILISPHHKKHFVNRSIPNRKYLALKNYNTPPPKSIGASKNKCSFLRLPILYSPSIPSLTSLPRPAFLLLSQFPPQIRRHSHCNQCRGHVRHRLGVEDSV